MLCSTTAQNTPSTFLGQACNLYITFFFFSALTNLYKSEKTRLIEAQSSLFATTLQIFRLSASSLVNTSEAEHKKGQSQGIRRSTAGLWESHVSFVRTLREKETRRGQGKDGKRRQRKEWSGPFSCRRRICFDDILPF